MNPPQECELISRKDIARRLGMSVSFIRRNEERLGFSEAKVVLSRQVVRYRAAVVERVVARIYDSRGQQSPENPS